MTGKQHLERGVDTEESTRGALARIHDVGVAGRQMKRTVVKTMFERIFHLMLGDGRGSQTGGGRNVLKMWDAN